MKCETQQQPILGPNHNSFYSDQTGWPLARDRARVKLRDIGTEKN